MDSQPVVCPRCRLRVPVEHVNIASLVGKCTGCDHVFRLELDWLPPAGEPPASNRDKSAGPSRPSGIQVEQDARGLLIKRSWFSPTLFFLLFFCIAWDAFLVFWYAMAIFAPAAGGGGFQWLAIIFPIAHVAVGVSLTYYVVAGFLNKTTFFTDRRMLLVRHAPIPWWSNRELDVKDLVALEMTMAYQEDSAPRLALSAVSQDGRQIVLASGLTPPQGRYIGFELAEFLGLEFREE